MEKKGMLLAWFAALMLLHGTYAWSLDPIRVQLPTPKPATTLKPVPIPKVNQTPASSPGTVQQVKPQTAPQTEPQMLQQLSPQAKALPDSDRDGIDDATETALLGQFSPFYLFSMQKAGGGGEAEHYNPADPIWYIRRSDLKMSGDEQSTTASPNSTCSRDPFCVMMIATDLLQNPLKSAFHINPLGKFAGDSNDPGRHGLPWETVLRYKNVGLFGHVVPYVVPQAIPIVFAIFPGIKAYWQSHWGPYAGRTLYKIEYWQFFGYNNADKAADIGDHEGDWATVQLLYDPEARKIVRVAHYAHGKEMSFFLHTATSRVPGGALWGAYEEFRGANFGKSFDDAGGTAGENTLRLLKDPETQAFSHPVVYVEYGSHEFWPTERGSFCVEIVLGYEGCAPPHGGNDAAHRYLTVNIPNLGEVEAHANSDALIILRYNGYWGTYSRKNSPPPGPALHTEWTWPTGSPLRARIPPEDFEN